MLRLANSPFSAAIISAALLLCPITASSDALPILDRSVFSRQDFIYGSEIGAWDTDGGNALHNPICRKNISDAGIRVLRFGNWVKLDKPDAKNAIRQFSQVIDGIRELGAYPFIKLPPIWDKQCNATPDAWSFEWLKIIVRTAGKRVQLYEFANEPDHYCKWNGTTYAEYWKANIVPLKAYARSLGFEIYVGGPAWANSYPENLPEIKAFLQNVKEAYVKSGNRDYLPDYVTTHTYLTEKENASIESMQETVQKWGVFYDNLRSIIDQELADLKDELGNPIGPQIKLVDSEYNFTINSENAQQNNPAFMDAYMKAMMDMFRTRHIWMANQFTLQSHNGKALDMLTETCEAKPLYNAYKAISAGGKNKKP